jgi:1,4-dihydroxy-2-naphthoate octaprenyltransferase
MMTENILHANNIRDIEVDSSAGIITLAIFFGFDISSNLYSIFFAIAYLSSLYIAANYHWGCVFVTLTIPIAVRLSRSCAGKNMSGLTEETAKLHFLFGVLFFLGIYLTKIGMVDLVSSSVVNQSIKNDNMTCSLGVC